MQQNSISNNHSQNSQGNSNQIIAKQSCHDFLPDMGSHLMLEFHNVTQFDLTEVKRLREVLENGLSKTDCNICAFQSHTYPNKDVSLIYLLSESHMSIHTDYENKSVAIDFYNCGQHSWQNLHHFEEAMCEVFGWNNCFSTILMPRGRVSSLMTNDFENKSDIIRGVKLLHREKSQYQELRIYEQKYFGTMLMLDGQLQICSGLKDEYSYDMSAPVFQRDQPLNNVLIIGGGDCLIASVLLEHSRKKHPIKKITMCELDPTVPKVVRQYFKQNENLIEESIKGGQFEFVFNEGAAFIAQRVKQLRSTDEQNEPPPLFDAVIIDCTDVCVEEALSSTLFTDEFYRNLYQVMAPNAIFSQMITLPDLEKPFCDKVSKAGFKEVKFTMMATPEYGSETPIGFGTKLITDQKEQQVA